MSFYIPLDVLGKNTVHRVAKASEKPSELAIGLFVFVRLCNGRHIPRDPKYKAVDSNNGRRS
jgi:hypothetical protein